MLVKFPSLGKYSSSPLNFSSSFRQMFIDYLEARHGSTEKTDKTPPRTQTKRTIGTYG